MKRRTLVVVAAVGSMCLGAALFAQAPDLGKVARNLVHSARVAPGDKVLVTGSVRDAGLLEDIAIETMKAGGQPLIALGSEQLTRRSYDEVPESYDRMEPSFDLALVKTTDVQISVAVGELDFPLAHVPQARLTARNKAYEPVTRTAFERNIRYVSLGNGLYPTAAVSTRLGIPQAELASVFWKAAGVAPEVLRTKGEELRGRFAKATKVTVTQPNGTDISFAVDTARGFVSDGAITAEKVKQGGAAVETWLPAGELLLPAVPGSANGKVVVDKLLWRGKELHGLTLTYREGRLVDMQASANLDALKAAYDGAGGAKDQFGYVDIGLNPETRLPLGGGVVVWTAPGSVTVGLGDNRSFGGSNASDFGLATQLPGATLALDGTVVIDKGTLK